MSFLSCAPLCKGSDGLLCSTIGAHSGLMSFLIHVHKRNSSRQRKAAPHPQSLWSNRSDTVKIGEQAESRPDLSFNATTHVGLAYLSKRSSGSPSPNEACPLIEYWVVY